MRKGGEGEGDWKKSEFFSFPFTSSTILQTLFSICRENDCALENSYKILNLRSLEKTAISQVRKSVEILFTLAGADNCVCLRPRYRSNVKKSEGDANAEFEGSNMFHVDQTQNPGETAQFLNEIPPIEIRAFNYKLRSTWKNENSTKSQAVKLLRSLSCRKNDIQNRTFRDFRKKLIFSS